MIARPSERKTPPRLRSVTTRSGSSGALTRASTTTKVTSSTADTTNMPTVTESLQPSDSARVKP